MAKSILRVLYYPCHAVQIDSLGTFVTVSASYCQGSVKAVPTPRQNWNKRLAIFRTTLAAHRVDVWSPYTGVTEGQPTGSQRGSFCE